MIQKQFTEEAKIAPDKIIKKLIDQMEVESTDKIVILNDFIKEYPNDPRGYFLKAEQNFYAQQYDQVIENAKKTLAQKDILNSRFSDNLIKFEVQLLWARSLSVQGKDKEALELFKSLCTLEVNDKARKQIENICR